MLLRGFLGSVLVLLGGLVTTTLPGGYWLFDVIGRWPWIEMRASVPGRMAGLTLVLVGLGMLASQWLALCHRPDVTRTHQAVAVWSLPLLIAPPLFSRDGWSYAAQGTMAMLDRSPYESGPGILEASARLGVDPIWLNTPAPYGPVPLWVGETASKLTADPWLLVVAHRGVALVGLVLLAWAITRLAGREDAPFATAIALASPLTIAHGVAGLHNDLLMVGLMAAALAVTYERGWLWGAALAGLAAGVKLPGGLVCVAIVLVSLPAFATIGDRVRRTTAVAGVSVGTLLAAGVASNLGQGWLGAMTVPGEVSTPLSITTMLGKAADVVLGLDGGATVAIRLLGVAAAVAIGGHLLATADTGDRDAANRALVLTLLAFIVLSPVVHLWYFLWLVPFAAVMPLSRARRTALVLLCLVSGLVAPLDSSLHGAYLVIVWGSMTAAGAFGALVLTRSGRERLDALV